MKKKMFALWCMVIVTVFNPSVGQGGPDSCEECCMPDTSEPSQCFSTCFQDCLSEPILLWECDFEPNTGNDQMCNMEQSLTDKFNWTLHSGSTTSGPSTGPAMAINGIYYIYTEASIPRRSGDIAMIFSPPIIGYTGPSCIQFYRHMLGDTMGSLSVQIKRIGQSFVSLQTIQGNQGFDWKEIRITAHIQENDQIVFRGVIGPGFSSDMALDNIRVTSLPCPNEA